MLISILSKYFDKTFVVYLLFYSALHYSFYLSNESFFLIGWHLMKVKNILYYQIKVIPTPFKFDHMPTRP